MTIRPLKKIYWSLVLVFVLSAMVIATKEIFLSDAGGAVRLSVPGMKQDLDQYSKSLILEAVRDKKVILSDLYRDENSQAIRLNLLIEFIYNRTF